jgi:hypothetical protein
MRRIGIAVLVTIAIVVAIARPARSREGGGGGGHASFVDEMDCSACHTPDGWGLSDQAGAKSGFDHAKTGFPLTGAHVDAVCTSCHRGDRAISRACDACHTDAHERRLGDDCSDCHSTRAWEDTRTAERHRRTRFPLTGMHAVIDCGACHVRTSERTWSDVPSDCFACHEDDYRRDIHPVHEGDPNDPSVTPLSRDCAQCHRPTAWSPAVVVPSQLPRIAAARSTLLHDVKFPIRWGKHRGASCDSCHPAAGTPRLVDCLGCHEGTTLRALHGRRVLPVDGAGCLRCHPGGTAR